MMQRFSSVLVANRGEIAVRVIKTARRMGLRTIAVYSEADAEAPHVLAADKSACIGPAPASESYLSADAILNAARACGADAIHPGYGFLSENADFARAVEQAGLVFVGPSADAIAAMGDKAGAKARMHAAGVPCVPGYHGADQSDDVLCSEAGKIGFSVMVKASAGGGGKGMRVVQRPEELLAALTQARSEALSGFGSDRLILEKAILNARHVEVQIFADALGHVIHLGERDCSVQRRHQKVIEESPCPAVDQELRDQMGAAAIAAARSVGYLGAGTVEFLLDAQGAFYFLEMNTRLQVEHPVTELVTGLDLVSMQLTVAQGVALPVTQSDLVFQGHAIEARLCAEDPENGFLPVAGQIALWRAPDHVRVDSGVATGTVVTPFYDPLLAKVIAHGPTREVARTRLIAALKDTATLGLTNNAAFLTEVLAQPVFVDGAATTEWLEALYPHGWSQGTTTISVALCAALLVQRETCQALFASLMRDTALLGFRSDGVADTPVALAVDGATHDLTVSGCGSARITVSGDGWVHEVDLTEKTAPRVDGGRLQVILTDAPHSGLFVQIDGRSHEVRRVQSWIRAEPETVSGQVVAPMPGTVISVLVKVGETLSKGQPVAVLEAMKMQHHLAADRDGIVQDIHVLAGQQIVTGAVVATLEDEE